MPTEKYVVSSGDNLWNIAKEKLGDGSQWPRIWRYNNRPDIIKRTGSSIPNPDIIHPNQILLIPRLPTHPLAQNASSRQTTTVPNPNAQSNLPASSGQPVKSPTSPSKPSRPLLEQLKDIKSPIAIKYRLDDIPFPPIVTPDAIISIRATGDVVMMTQKSYPATYVTQRGEIETQVVTQSNHAFGSLVSDTRIIYDGTRKQITLRNMLVSQSNIPNSVGTAVGIEMDSQNPVPRLRAEFRFPKIEGRIGLFRYSAVNVKLVIEITLTPKPSPGPRAQPIRAPQPSFWDKVVGTGIVIVGGAIIVGTIVEDFLTLGAGVADDPVSFAGGGLSISRGLAMWGPRITAVLPTAMPRAALRLSVSVLPMVVPQGQLVMPR